MEDFRGVERGIEGELRVTCLIEERQDQLVLCIYALELLIKSQFLSNHFNWEWLICFVVASEEREYRRVCREVFHDDGWQFREIGSATSAGYFLEIGTAENGVDRVAHLVDQHLLELLPVVQQEV